MPRLPPDLAFHLGLFLLSLLPLLAAQCATCGEGKVATKRIPLENDSTFRRVGGIELVDIYEITRERDLGVCGQRCDARRDCAAYEFKYGLCVVARAFKQTGEDLRKGAFDKEQFIKVTGDEIEIPEEDDACVAEEVFNAYFEKEATKEMPPGTSSSTGTLPPPVSDAQASSPLTGTSTTTSSSENNEVEGSVTTIEPVSEMSHGGQQHSTTTVLERSMSSGPADAGTTSTTARTQPVHTDDKTFQGASTGSSDPVSASSTTTVGSSAPSVSSSTSSAPSATSSSTSSSVPPSTSSTTRAPTTTTTVVKAGGGSGGEKEDAWTPTTTVEVTTELSEESTGWDTTESEETTKMGSSEVPTDETSETSGSSSSSSSSATSEETEPTTMTSTTMRDESDGETATSWATTTGGKMWYDPVVKAENVSCHVGNTTCSCGEGNEIRVTSPAGDVFVALSVFKNASGWFAQGQTTKESVLMDAPLSMVCFESVAKGGKVNQCPAPVVVNGQYTKEGISCSDGMAFKNATSSQSNICFDVTGPKCASGSWTCQNSTVKNTNSRLFFLAVSYCEKINGGQSSSSSPTWAMSSADNTGATSEPATTTTAASAAPAWFDSINVGGEVRCGLDGCSCDDGKSLTIQASAFNFNPNNDKYYNTEKNSFAATKLTKNATGYYVIGDVTPVQVKDITSMECVVGTETRGCSKPVVVNGQFVSGKIVCDAKKFVRIASGLGQADCWFYADVGVCVDGRYKCWEDDFVPAVIYCK